MRSPAVKEKPTLSGVASPARYGGTGVKMRSNH